MSTVTDDINSKNSISAKYLLQAPNNSNLSKTKFFLQDLSYVEGLKIPYRTTTLLESNLKTESKTLKPQPGLFELVNNLPNACSLLGLLSAVLSIFFTIQGNFQMAIIGALWAVLFDWYDGIIARKMKNRTSVQGVFGGQLDSLIDVVSFGVLPAILLLSYGNYSLWFVPGAFVIVATSTIRLSYFNIYGLINSKTYKGLSLDNNVLILAFAFIFEGFFDHETFSVLVYGILMTLSFLNLSSISTPKLGGNWVYILILYVFGLTSFFGSLLYYEV